jgi:hypothetical protein
LGFGLGLGASAIVISEDEDDMSVVATRPTRARSLSKSDGDAVAHIEAWSRRCSEQSKRCPAEFVKYYFVQKLFSPVSLATLIEYWLSTRSDGESSGALAGLCFDMFKHSRGRHIVMTKAYVDVFGVDDLRIPCSKVDSETAVVLAVVWKHFASYFSRLAGNEVCLVLSRSRYVIDIHVGLIVEATFLVFVRRLINRYKAGVINAMKAGTEFDGFVSTLMGSGAELTACVWKLTTVYRQFIHIYFGNNTIHSR